MDELSKSRKVAFRKQSNAAVDLTGQRFVRLTAIKDSGKRTNGKILWECVCDCDSTIPVYVRSSHLIGGQIQSCGCLQREVASVNATTHGRSRDRVYAVYRTMLARCSNPKNAKWTDYGGRGIKICRRWRGTGGFERFLQDMGEPPSNKHTVERKNNYGDYTTRNCIWVLHSLQARNKRNNRYVTFNGVTKLLVEWANEVGVSYKELHRRIISRGWSVETALTTPVRLRRGQKRAR